MGKLGPKRHRDLPKVMNQLFPLFSLKSLSQPTLQGPPLARATALDQRAGLYQATPVVVPWAFRVEVARRPDSFTSPGCRVLRTTVRLQALPFHSKPGFLFTPSIGSKQNKGHSLCSSFWAVLFPLGSPAQIAQDSLHPWGFVARKPNYPKSREIEVLTLTKPHLTRIVGGVKGLT